MKRYAPLVLALMSVVGLPLAGAGETGRVFDPPRAPKDSRLKSAVTLDGYHHWAPPGDLETWKKRRATLRRQILVAAGLWPLPPRTALEPVIHGKIDREDYTIEKVFFQSYPGFYVTGNLYRPKGGGEKKPAVLSPHGHWRDGRLHERPEGEAKKLVAAGEEKTLESARYHIQARCAGLARLGCVVFHYDMVGYADSRQIGHRQGFGDVEAELRLESAFGLQTWNTLRALDFLLDLPDVDPRRVGVTGASGGGTQTFILCAIDGRPAVGFPAVMVSTGMQGGCVCENASHLRVATTNVEFAAMAAPRPYAMTGANDWTKEILTKGLPELKALYKLHGQEERVQAWCHTEFDHNYNQVSREHMYDWFNRHLELGHPSPVNERPFRPVKPDELRVFDAEHSLPADAVDARKLRRWLTDTSDRQLTALVPRDREGLKEFRRVIGGALETLLHTRLPAGEDVEHKVHGSETIDGYELTRLTLARKGSGEEVPAVLLKPGEWNGVVVVAANPRGKSQLFSPAPEGDGRRVQAIPAHVLQKGAAILSPDVFLTGEYLEGDEEGPAGPDSGLFPKDKGRHGSYVGYTYGYNRTLIAERVHDLLTAVAYASALPGCRAVHLAGGDEASTWTLLAAALAGSRVGKIFVGGSLSGFSRIESHDDPDFLPGALKYGGLPFFTALSAPTPLRLAGDVSREEVVVSAYRASGHAGAVEYVGGDIGRERGEALLEWLSRRE